MAAPAEPIEIEGARPFDGAPSAEQRPIGACNALELEAARLDVVEQSFGDHEVRAICSRAGLVEYFLDVPALTELTGHPVRTTYRTSEEKSLPRADAIVVAPATYNTINKWAGGIVDNYVLNQLAELTGLGAHSVVLPFVNQGLAANPVFTRNVEKLRQAGVRVLFGPGETEPHPPRTGDTVLDSYPWDRALAAAQK